MKEYLVIQLARFGDLIQTKRLMVTLGARPDSRVHLCLDHSLEGLARLVYPDAILHPVLAHGTGLPGPDDQVRLFLENRRAFRELTKVPFDAVFNLNFSGLNFRLAALFDPSQVHGYSWHNGQELVGSWPAMAMRWSARRRLGLNLMDFWAGYCLDMVPPKAVNPEAAPRGGGLGIVLAGRESRRSLPVPVLARIATTLAQSLNSPRVVLLGSGAEHKTGLELLKTLPSGLQEKTENLAGKTNWDDLVDVVGSLDRLVTPDTGTMHLAAHLGVPVTAFFLSSAWCFETGPYGWGHTVYQADTHCLPCLETRPCDQNLKCLKCFNSPEFLRFMVTGRVDHAPSHLLALTSDFDQLGQTYVPFAGEDRDETRRREFRNFVFQYLSGQETGVGPAERQFAETLWREKDWMTRT